MENLIYFIDPEWIYIAGISNAVLMICTLGLVVMVLWWVIYVFGSWVTLDFKGSYRMVFFLSVMVITFLVGVIFLPSEDALLNMKIAELVRTHLIPEKIDSVSDQLKDMIRIMSGG